MSARQRTWAVVLAAGDGTRLAALTTDENGRLVPKQFCSLNGGGSLLQGAIQRARGMASRNRICVIVADQHRRYWHSALHGLSAKNVIVQPRNCGTANGILLCVLTILERDPLARIVFLPADHYVCDERLLAGSLRKVTALMTRNPDGLIFLGIEPDDADPGFGYIVPGRELADGAHSVIRFVEKPQIMLAQQLCESGALWNTFIFAARGSVLLEVLRARLPSEVSRMEAAILHGGRLGARAAALRDLYESLPTIDFSGAVVHGAERELRVITAPTCGWNDLGTPERVAGTLQRLKRERSLRTASAGHLPSYFPIPAVMNLAARQLQMKGAG